MHLTDIGTVVRSDAKTFVWACSGPWVEIVEQLGCHVRQVVHAEMGKPADRAPKSVLVLTPQITRVAPNGQTYSAESEIIRDPRGSETKRPGAVLFRFDTERTTRNRTIAHQLSEIEDRFRRATPPAQPGPIT